MITIYIVTASIRCQLRRGHCYLFLSLPISSLKATFQNRKKYYGFSKWFTTSKIFNVAFTLLFCDEQEGRKKIFYSVFLDYFLGEEKQSLWTRKTASLGSKSRIETLNKGWNLLKVTNLDYEQVNICWTTAFWSCQVCVTVFDEVIFF